MSFRAIAKEFTFYSISYFFMQLVTIALAIYIRNVLGPEMMGVWVSLQVVLAYTKYSNLGLASAAAREIPFEKGRNHFGEAERIRNASYTFTLMTAAVLSGALFVAAPFVRGHYGNLVFYSLITLGFLSFFQRASTFCVSILRAEKKFDFINRFNVYSALVNAVLTVFLIKAYGLYGYYASMVLSLLFNWGFVLYGSGVRFNLDWRWKGLAPLFKMGLGLIVMNMLYTFVSSVDKIAISTRLGMEWLGIYSLPIMVNSLIVSFPNNLGIIVFPYLNEAHGASDDKGQVQKLVVLPTRFMATYMPLFVAGIWLVAPLLVPAVLPKYERGIEAMKVSLFATLFMILANNMSDALITFKKYLWSIPVQAVVGGLLLGADILWIRSGAGIREVAWSMLIGFAALYAIYACIALRAFYSASETAWETAGVLARGGYLLGALLLADHLWPEQNLTAFLLRSGLVSACALPLLIAGEKNFRTFDRVGQIISTKLGGALRKSPTVGRALMYSDSKNYWEKRGGERYFGEQEARADRGATSRFLAEEIGRLGAASILEVGCGYGKVLRSLREFTAVPLTGVDFSSSQLTKAKEYLEGLEDISLVSADAERLPFPDNAFDVVFTSNVILHNAPDKAEKMRREIVRVSKRYIVHKEDTDVNFSRYGYDHAAIYGTMGLKVLRAEKVACAADSEITQFTVVEKSSGRLV